MNTDDSMLGGRRSEVGDRLEGNPNSLPSSSSTLHPPPSTVSSALSPLPHPPHPRRLRRAFTLVEMLVVIGIFGLLMGVTVTIFDGIGKGAKMRAALMELKSSLALARQYAITEGNWLGVTVVFPDKDVDLGGNPALYTTRYQSYYICNRTHSNETVVVAGKSNIVRRIYPGKLGTWHHLPKGIVFDRNRIPAKSDYENVFKRSGDNVHNIQFPIATDGSWKTQACVAIYFHPNGRLQDGYESDGRFYTPQIFLTEGIVETDPTTGTELAYSLHANATVYGVEVRPLTGRIKITELTAP